LYPAGEGDVNEPTPGDEAFAGSSLFPILGPARRPGHAPLGHHVRNSLNRYHLFHPLLFEEPTMKGLKKPDFLNPSVPERILLVEDMGDSIAAVPEAVSLNEAQRAELDRRAVFHARRNPRRWKKRI
jgi:putative addiction module component (TIGR02574 family)